MTAAEALLNPELLREVAYRAKADRRTVVSLLKGEPQKRPSGARARARIELLAAGVSLPEVTPRPAPSSAEPPKRLRVMDADGS